MSDARPARLARQRNSSFRRDIEGLRAVAVLLVVLYHAHVLGVSGGYVGVDVFFVISGYLITQLLWREISGSGQLSLGRFYARRARRLLPASLLVIGVTLIVARVVLSPLVMPSVARDALATTLYAVNFRFAAAHTDYLTVSSPSPFQHYWSLAVEEQFYLVWPLLMLAGSTTLRRPRAASAARAATSIGALGCVSFAVSLALTHRSPSWAFFSLPTRAWELAVGATVALAVPASRRVPQNAAAAIGWLGLGAIGWSAARYSSTTAFPGTAALLPVCGAAAVLVAGEVTRRTGPVALLKARPLQRIGRLSYSWYLWHWPVLVLAAAWAGRSLRAGERVGLVLASLALAALTNVFVEEPLRFAPVLVRRPARTLLAALAVTAIAAGASLVVIADVPALHGRHARAAAVPRLPTERSAGSAPDRAHQPVTVTGPSHDPAQSALRATLSPVAATISRSLATAPVPSNLEPDLRRAHGDRALPFDDGCFDSFADTRVHRCDYGNKVGSRTIVLFGDSHATHWFPALEPVAAAHGWRLVVLTKATCPPLATPVWSPEFGREYRECDTWRTAALARIAAEHPVLVLLGMNRNYGPVYHLQEYGPVWLHGLADMVRTIHASGSQVLALGPEPLQAGDVPTCLADHLDDAAACATQVHDALNRGGIAAERAAVTSAGGHYIDLTSWFCVTAGCPVVVGNLLVFRDQNHVTTAYATWLAPLLGAEVDLALGAR